MVTTTEFDAERQYKVFNNRRVVFSNPLNEAIEVSYLTNPAVYNGGPNYPDARFNVYPDPNQPNQPEGLSVEYGLEDSDSTPTYTINIGSIRSQQISLSSEEDVLLTNSDLNFGLAQKLPKWIDDLEDESPIPQYALYLKNYTTNEAYTTATYTKVDSNTILMSDISIGNQACINGFDLRLVTVGTDITTSIDDLRNKMFLHNDGSFGEPLVEIQNLAGIYKLKHLAVCIHHQKIVKLGTFYQLTCIEMVGTLLFQKMKTGKTLCAATYDGFY